MARWARENRIKRSLRDERGDGKVTSDTSLTGGGPPTNGPESVCLISSVQAFRRQARHKQPAWFLRFNLSGFCYNALLLSLALAFGPASGDSSTIRERFRL